MNRIATFLFLLTFVQQISAQVSRIPLESYPTVKDERAALLPKGYSRSLEKAACDPSDPDKTYVEAGQTALIIIDIDTFNVFPQGGTFTCANCETAQYGQARLSATGDTLLYTANEDVLLGEDAIEIRYCSDSDPSDCQRNRVYRIVAKRPGQHYYIPALSVTPGGLSEYTMDTNVLPAALSCNYFVDCEDEYIGRDQLTYFSAYNRPDNKVIYRASRYPGVDSICVGICDINAVCDTFHLAFEIAPTVLGLPFMDDFSYDGPATDPMLWLDREVYVNKTMAIDPPSIGVATMDGLGANGKPYGGDPGEADRLTSTYIDLEGEIGNVVLTYWVQRRGYGDKPEAGDSLRLEFKSQTGNWERIVAYGGVPANQPNTVAEPFRFYATPVPANYRHDSFQFRFVNISDRQGVRDNWHLDYIRMSTEETDSIFADVAFTKPPEPILENYSAMPWNHFRAQDESLLADSLEVSLFNHADETLSVIPSSVTLIEQNTAVSPFGAPLTLFNGQEANIPNGMTVDRTYGLQGDPRFANIWATYTAAMFGPNYPDNADLRFRMTYRLTNDSQVETPGYESVQENDMVSSVTVFEDYFAYDDGSAEQGLVAQEGTEVAIAFEAGVADSIRAVRFMHPRSNIDVSDQEFEILIWIGTLDDTPEYSMVINPFFADVSFDTIQGFTTYTLLDEDGELAPVPIPAGPFYVGWNQVTPCTFNQCVPVGYDRNRTEGAAFTYVNVGQGWNLISEPEQGSLMIRPIVGAETPVPTKAKDPIAEQDFVNLFPNPSRGKLYLRTLDGRMEDLSYVLYNPVGQLVDRGAVRSELDFGQYPAGLYTLQIRNNRTGIVQISKISLLR
ncbi:T9SS type A sorting domain-containing protein [Flavilitoribacter nigricans]|uniref:Secretion system C-terminal sorting domain-containing protein n=1 Tax=Flavilitoribacter nigricans (strain ATCC 23147 / DSM 23189 / NBRC 102662 / NCIMB 1420 / SS-2) TaxID=1122177 RepID=A0A2D0NAC8_FLAN2|nr:T9SS type A sorting domain-containing protein [Flavilitoribacter nigricans]PHN05338.1 hypothetical protein CRP01_17635 [Flavilitoribacter nigricans DSM 23189 = NBRC 102662]